MDTPRQLNRTIRRFFRDERGATAIEYAMIAAGIAVTIVTAVTPWAGSSDVRDDRHGDEVVPSNEARSRATAD